MEQFHGTDWMWDIHLSHKETNVCFRLSPTQAKCPNPIALPSERWISVPLRQLIPSGFLSRGFSRSPWMALKHSLSIGQTQPFSFMGSDNNCFPPSSGEYRERRKSVPHGGLQQKPSSFPFCLSARLALPMAGQPWKSKLRPHSPTALLAFCSLPREHFKER